MPDGSRAPKAAVVVAQRIVADIDAGGNAVGDRLPPEKAMLEEYQVARGTLREALRFLELQGVITLKPGPGGGPVVRRPDATALATALTLLLQFDGAPLRCVEEARLALEPATARLAAVRAGSEVLGELAANLDQARAALGDADEFDALDRRFHALVAGASGNPMLRHLLDASAVLVRRPSSRTELRSAVLAGHQRVLEALVARRAEAAGAAMSADVERHVDDLESTSPETLDSPTVWRG